MLLCTSADACFKVFASQWQVSNILAFTIKTVIIQTYMPVHTVEITLRLLGVCLVCSSARNFMTDIEL